MKEELLKAYNDYAMREFESEPISELPSDGILHVAYTESENGKEIQCDIDFNRCAWLEYIDGELWRETVRDSLESFIQELRWCNFDDIVSDAMWAADEEE